MVAVGIIAILKEEDGPKIVLGKQFRPPCETICIEMPAGIFLGFVDGRID
jgi:hypothetical protein